MLGISNLLTFVVTFGSSSSLVTISGGGSVRLLCLLSAVACVVSVAPPPSPAHGAPFRHPPMLHVIRHGSGGVKVVRQGARPNWSSPVLPRSSSPEDDDGDNERVVYAEPEEEIRSELKGDRSLAEKSDVGSTAPEPSVRFPRRPVLPHLSGYAASGGIRKTVSTPGREEEKRWAPTEIRMNEFIHKIRAVNAASRLNRRVPDDTEDPNYDWWAHRVRRQRQQQADGAKAAQALQLYGLRTRMGE